MYGPIPNPIDDAIEQAKDKGSAALVFGLLLLVGVAVLVKRAGR